jgi:hypothetical protein
VAWVRRSAEAEAKAEQSVPCGRECVVGVGACGRGALPVWGARRLERDIVVRVGVGALWAWGECRGENGTTRQTDGEYDGDGPDEGMW